jgi:hypothetical protein
MTAEDSYLNLDDVGPEEGVIEAPDTAQTYLDDAEEAAPVAVPPNPNRADIALPTDSQGNPPPERLRVDAGTRYKPSLVAPHLGRSATEVAASTPVEQPTQMARVESSTPKTPPPPAEQQSASKQPPQEPQEESSIHHAAPEAPAQKEVLDTTEPAVTSTDQRPDDDEDIIPKEPLKAEAANEAAPTDTKADDAGDGKPPETDQTAEESAEDPRIRVYFAAQTREAGLAVAEDMRTRGVDLVVIEDASVPPDNEKRRSLKTGLYNFIAMTDEEKVAAGATESHVLLRMAEGFTDTDNITGGLLKGLEKSGKRIALVGPTDLDISTENVTFLQTLDDGLTVAGKTFESNGMISMLVFAEAEALARTDMATQKIIEQEVQAITADHPDKVIGVVSRRGREGIENNLSTDEAVDSKIIDKRGREARTGTEYLLRAARHYQTKMPLTEAFIDRVTLATVVHFGAVVTGPKPWHRDVAEFVDSLPDEKVTELLTEYDKLKSKARSNNQRTAYLGRKGIQELTERLLSGE